MLLGLVTSDQLNYGNKLFYDHLLRLLGSFDYIPRQYPPSTSNTGDSR
jgi:hypothetical protein